MCLIRWAISKFYIEQAASAASKNAFDKLID